MPVTLGVMARAPVPGRCKTRLSPPLSAQQAAALYRAMLEDSFSAYARVDATRLVVMAAPEDGGPAMLRELAPAPWEVVVQQGADLGQRLAHAFSTLGGRGETVALVDSDSPTVPVAPITRGLAALGGQDRALVGPCEDGGYYLIALGAVSPRGLQILAGIPWSTSQVMPATRARCAALGLSLDELPVWYDVDDAGDLERLGGELRRDPALAPRTAAWLQARTGKVTVCASR
jgi:rSAM/selenodomain-associated transferase 1